MRHEQTEYDAVVIGSGPNGLAATILLQQQGLRVLILEAKKEIGEGCVVQNSLYQYTSMIFVLLYIPWTRHLLF